MPALCWLDMASVRFIGRVKGASPVEVLVAGWLEVEWRVGSEEWLYLQRIGLRSPALVWGCYPTLAGPSQAVAPALQHLDLQCRALRFCNSRQDVESVKRFLSPFHG
jgi:hypothetical protein